MKRIIAILILVVSLSPIAFAQSETRRVVYTDGDSISFDRLKNDKDLAAKPPRTQAPQEVDVKAKTEFRWGASAGASIDMSAQDLSSIDFDINFGMSHSWIKYLGIGVQANIMTASSNRAYPIYAVFRTNFKRTQSRVFWELKGGMSLNYFEGCPDDKGFYGSTGVGFVLASGKKFASYMSLSYSYLQRRDAVVDEATLHFKDVHGATVKIGVLF